MGQGAAQAIEDACALGAILTLGTAPERVPSRLVLWQQCRKDRAAKIVLHTRHRSRKADGSQGPPQTSKCVPVVSFTCVCERAETKTGSSQSTNSTGPFRTASTTTLTSMLRSNSRSGVRPRPWRRRRRRGC